MRAVRLLSRAALCTIALATAFSAVAQDDVGEFEAATQPDLGEAEAVEDEQPSQGIEEIIVTAQRRESVLQETPVAITVFDQSELDQRGIADLQGLSYNVPNFHYGEVLGQARITIRGISTAGGDQAAAFHIDGIYQDSALIPSSISFFDLARVETLRGPQGTLAGRNATGGALFLVTNPPSFDFELFSDISFGNYHEIITRAVVNVPVVEEKVAVRLSVIQDRHYGYTQNEVFDVRNKDVDDQRLAGLRSQIRIKPIESLDWVVRSIYSESKPRGGGLKVDGALPSFVIVDALPDPIQDYYATGTPNPSDPRRAYLDTPEQTNTRLIGGSSTLTWQVPTIPFLGDTDLVMMGGWQERKQTSFADVDRTDATAFGIAFDLVNTDVGLFQREWVAELNWTSQNEDDALNWVAGFFYLGTEGTLSTNTRANLPFTFSTPPPFDRSVAVVRTTSLVSSKGQSLAGFADATLDVTDEFTLTAGARYSVDWKEGDRHADRINATLLNPALAFLNPVCITEGVDSQSDDRWEAWTGRAKAQWQYNEDVMMYGSYSRGYKAGTIEFVVPGSCTDPVSQLANTDPEIIDAYEVGIKTDSFDNRFQANVTAFFYDYDNIQVATLVQSTVVTENAAGAQITGLELELAALPIDGLFMTLNFAYLYTRYTDFTDGCLVEEPGTCAAGMGLDFTNNELPRAPRLSGTVTAQYTWDLDQYGTLTPFAQIFASDKLFFRGANSTGDNIFIPPRTVNGQTIPGRFIKSDVQEAYWLLDARLTWESPTQHLMIEAYVANALDKDVVNTKLISTPLLGSPQLTAYAPPRTFGTRVTLRW